MAPNLRLLPRAEQARSAPLPVESVFHLDIRGPDSHLEHATRHIRATLHLRHLWQGAPRAESGFGYGTGPCSHVGGDPWGRPGGGIQQEFAEWLE